MTLQHVKLDELDKGSMKLVFTAATGGAWPGEYAAGLGMMDILAVENICCYHSGIHCAQIRTRRRPPAPPPCFGVCVVPGCTNACALLSGHSEHIKHYCGETACTATCSTPFCSRPCSHDHWHSLEGRAGEGAFGQTSQILHDCGFEDHTCGRLRELKCSACDEVCCMSVAVPHLRHVCKHAASLSCVFMCWVPGCSQRCISSDHYNVICHKYYRAEEYIFIGCSM